MTLDANEEAATNETQNDSPEPQEQASGEDTPPEATQDTGDEGEGAAGNAEAEESKHDEKHRRAGGWQRRAERLERQNQILLEQLAHRPGQQPTAAPPPTEKTSDEKVAEYLDGLVETRLQAREQQRQRQEIQAQFQRRAAEVRAAHPDWDDVVSSADVPVSAAVQQAILTSEQGPAIMYQLAANPAELARISALPPLDAAREVGRLEAKLSLSTATPQAKPVQRKPSAPAPITPVTARGPSTVKRPEDMTYEEYNAWRDSQRKR
jgi:hypothetical protein